MNATIARAQLTATDRCDRCGARAYIKVTLPGGGELLFCAHHGRAHESALRRSAVHFHDESELLAATPAVAEPEER